MSCPEGPRAIGSPLPGRGRGRAPASPRAGAEPEPNKARPEREPRVKQPGLFLPVPAQGGPRARLTPIPGGGGGVVPLLLLLLHRARPGHSPGSPVGGSDRVHLPARVGGGRGGGESSGNRCLGGDEGARREPRGGRLAGAGSREGRRANLRAQVPPPLPARSKAEEPPALPALPVGDDGAAPPRPGPRRSRGPARLRPVAAPWQEEPLTPPGTRSRAGGRWAAALRQSPRPTQTACAGAANRRRRTIGAQVGEGRAGGAARGGAARSR